MSYKSKHTGAQVDEAVSKVLNGEVGGGADWNAQEGEPGYIENKPFEFIDKGGNAFYYDADYNPNYIIWDSPSAYDCSVIQILDYDGFPQYIYLDGKTDGSLGNMDHIFTSYLNYKWLENGELGIEIPSHVFDEGEDVSTYLNDLIKYSTGGIIQKISDVYLPNTVLKTTPQKFSNAEKNQARLNIGISTPDWNAKEGEAGYIENKTHHLVGKSEYTLGKGVTQIPYGGERFAYYNNNIIELPNFENELQHSIISGPPIFIKYIRNKYGKQVIELIDNYNYFDNNIIEFYLGIKTIDPLYIPNRVLKTTPQTLSDPDKNQALSNLGIDNTKYILSVAPDNKFNIREFIDKFGFIPELNDDGYGGYIGDLVVTNKELFLDNVLCCGFNTSLAKCIYVKDSDVVFFFEEGLAKGNVKVRFAENDINSTPTMICWEPIMN